MSSPIKKADCFYITLHLIQCYLLGCKNIQSLMIEAGFAPVEPISPYLVHGFVDDKHSRRIAHSWIEVGGYVIEYSSTNDIVVDLSTYEKNQKAVEVRRFTPREAFKMLEDGHSVGFWDDPKVDTSSPCPTYEELLALSFHDKYHSE